MPPTDSDEYTARKRFFAKMLTIYGRKPVLEALQDNRLQPFKLHLAESNKPAAIIQDIENAAQRRNVTVEFHTKAALSRISKNGKQDQGVALDVRCPGFTGDEEFLAELPDEFQLIALDSVTNPQNLGMIIRTVCASPMHGLLLPEKGCARLDALVIKASAGTLFKARLIFCQDLAKSLQRFQTSGARIYGLAADASDSIGQLDTQPRSIFVLGNESRGLSPECRQLCNQFVRIPMANRVESLNVSIAAALIAFRGIFTH